MWDVTPLRPCDKCGESKADEEFYPGYNKGKKYQRNTCKPCYIKQNMRDYVYVEPKKTKTAKKPKPMRLDPFSRMANAIVRRPQEKHDETVAP